MSDCGCDEDDDLDGLLDDTGLPDDLCAPDGAVTSAGSLPVIVVHPLEPADCLDWAGPIRQAQVSLPYNPNDPNDPNNGGVRPGGGGPGSSGPGCNGFPNAFPSQSVTWTGNRDNCGPGFQGAVFTHTLPIGTYCSPISQALANAQATAWLNINGPVLARQYGTCVPLPANGFVSMVFNGTSGCPSGLIDLHFGDMVGNITSGCATIQVGGTFLNLEFGNSTGNLVSNCGLPGSQFEVLEFTGVSGCA